MSDDNKLVMMANQIGKFYVPQKQVEPVGAIATHLRKFWDPRMRAAIISPSRPRRRRARSAGPRRCPAFEGRCLTARLFGRE